MVKILIILSLLFSASSFSDERRFSPEKLKQYNKGAAISKSEAISRFKSRKGTNTYMNNKKVTYRMPSGKYVHGIVLPNGKVSPAIKVDDNLHPACVLTTGDFVAGVFDDSSDIIICDIPKQDLQIIDATLHAVKKKPKKIAEENKAKTVVVSKYRNNSSGTIKNASSNKKPKPEKNKAAVSKIVTNDNVYRPPANRSFSSSVQSKVVSTGVKPYGIKIGEWAEVELLRHVTSVDSDLVEFTMNTSLEGKYKSLPVGTVLFGSKRFNSQNKRLEVFIKKALTPNDNEIDSINAWVYAPDKTAGLHGVIVRDREAESDAAASKAALNGLSAIAAPIGGGGMVAGAVAKSYAGDMVNNERKYLPETPRAIIKVAPQLALIKISKSF